jgi:hypothetical protein
MLAEWSTECRVVYMITEKLTAIKVENCEGDGECSRCNRTGLIWVVTLSDGTRVGGECAKILLGWKPTKASHSWVTGMTVAAEKTVGARHIVLWVKGNRAAVAINGNLQTSGPVEWVTKEYASRYF